MALLQDLEPPSSEERDGVKNLEKQTQTTIEKNAKAFGADLDNDFKPPIQRLSFLWSKCLNLLNQIGETALNIKNSIPKLKYGFKFFFSSAKYLPHYGLLLLLGVVLATNLTESAKAYALANNLIEVNPSDEAAIVQTIDQFTILTGNETEAVTRANQVQTSVDGFVASTGSPDTFITEREEPLPDNSQGTVYYLIRGGDTLSRLTIKFGVSAATLKYVNDLTSVDQLKVGFRLKVPIRGYAVSASVIAAKQKTATAAATKKTTQIAKQYYGTVNGVRYIEKSWGQCYTYVTSLGYNVGGHYLARWIPTNSSVPRAGGLVVTFESWAGHVAVVTSVNSDGTFNLRERNYVSGWITERTLHSNDAKIKGFVN